MYCHNCGHRNPEGVNFCSSCGAALAGTMSDTTVALRPVDDHGDLSEEDPAVTLVEVPHGAAVLVVQRGPNVGVRYVLDSAVTRAGRSPECQIFLDDITVSRRHAEIERQGRRLVLRDVGSLNGTYRNRRRIEGDEVLEPGDEVQIGKFKLVYLVAGDE